MQVVNGRKPHRLNIPRDAVTREVADLRGNTTRPHRRRNWAARSDKIQARA
jgi:hypothetical protein